MKSNNFCFPGSALLAKVESQTQTHKQVSNCERELTLANKILSRFKVELNLAENKSL